jgi:2-polyprenyl-6-hydroxyphenyl methylase/3-demethylubiquinone-9 3-methyltransferase
MTSKSFYDEVDPDEAMRIYLEQRKDIYERRKESVIAEVLDGFYRTEGGLRGKSVLEIGAAGGIFTSRFLGHGATVTCVDICEPIIAKSRELHPAAQFFIGDATDIDIPDSNCRFDLVFAKDVIEHIDRDAMFLKNMYRYVKPGGAIVVVTQNSQSLNYLVQGGYHYLRGNWPWYGWDYTHLRFYSSRTLRKVLRESGFAPDRWFGSYYFPYRLLSDRLGRWIEGGVFCLPEILHFNRAWPLDRLGWSIGVIARKLNHA